MIRAIVFDFDGTLANTLPSLAEGVNRMLLQLELPTHTEEEVRTFINRGARELCRSALPASLRADEKFLDRALAVYNDAYAEVCENARLYDGVAELLSALHPRYRVGVLSNKPHAFLLRLCNAILPKGSFDAVQGVVDGATKPDPALTGRLLDALGVPADECLMVGDSTVDIATARAAGMQHLGVTWGFQSEEILRTAGAKSLAATSGEILQFLASADAQHV